MGSDKIIVKHFQWLGWPDHGVPDPKSYSSLLFFVKQILNYKKKKRESIIVHCRLILNINTYLMFVSAGVGRTGTLVALANLTLIVKKIKKHIKNKPSILDSTYISVFSIVRRMREQRCKMVETYVYFCLYY